MNNNFTKDCWDKAEIIAQIIGYIFIPVVVAVTGWFINQTLQQKELNVKNLEMAVDVLRTEPNDETRAIREWALRSFLKYTPVRPSKAAIEELKMSVLPSNIFIHGGNTPITGGPAPVPDGNMDKYLEGMSE